MKKNLFVYSILFFVLVACQENVIQKDYQYSISEANAGEKGNVSKWLSNASGRISTLEYNPERLKVLVDKQSKYQLLTILNSSKGNEAISFSLDNTGSVAFAFKTKAYKDSNGNITNEFYTLDGVFKFSFIDYPNGRREIINRANSSNGKTQGWWSDADDCVGQFHNISPSNIGNIAAIVVFDAATLGLYSGLSVVLCAGYATAKQI